MATPDELLVALRAALETTGAMPRLRAKVRAEVARALDVGAEAEPRGEKPEELVFVNALVFGYLSEMGFRDAAAVFQAEADVGDGMPFGREFMARRVGVVDDEESAKLPLLFAMTERAKAWAKMAKQDGRNAAQEVPTPPRRSATTRYGAHDDDDDDDDDDGDVSDDAPQVDSD